MRDTGRLYTGGEAMQATIYKVYFGDGVGWTKGAREKGKGVVKRYTLKPRRQVTGQADTVSE